jgi:hypothetical protein
VYWLWLYYSSDQYSHKWLFCLSITSLDSRRCIFAWPLWCCTLQPSPVHDSAYELRCNPWTCCFRIGIHSLCPCSRSHVIEHIYIYIYIYIYGGFNMIFLWKILYIELWVNNYFISSKIECPREFGYTYLFPGLHFVVLGFLSRIVLWGLYHIPLLSIVRAYRICVPFFIWWNDTID